MTANSSSPASRCDQGCADGQRPWLLMCERANALTRVLYSGNSKGWQRALTELGIARASYQGSANEDNIDAGQIFAPQI